MQLGLSFSFLLTALLFALARVEAAPAKRSPRIVTLPLKRVQQPTDADPSVVSPILDILFGLNCGTDLAPPDFATAYQSQPPPLRADGRR